MKAELPAESLHWTFQRYVPSDKDIVLFIWAPDVKDEFVMFACHAPVELSYKMHESMFVSEGVYWNVTEPVLFQVLFPGASNDTVGFVLSIFRV